VSGDDHLGMAGGRRGVGGAAAPGPGPGHRPHARAGRPRVGPGHRRAHVRRGPGRLHLADHRPGTGTAGDRRGVGRRVTRTLEFAGRSVSIELEIGPEIIVGQIYPLQAGRLTLLTPAGEESDVTADDVGCFTFPRPPGGPFRLRCTTADAGVITDWICMT
jgi:hypothetical protein